LGFNRALLMLFDEESNTLTGAMALGFLGRRSFVYLERIGETRPQLARPAV
jgi:hypothetical protein